MKINREDCIKFIIKGNPNGLKKINEIFKEFGGIISSDNKMECLSGKITGVSIFDLSKEKSNEIKKIIIDEMEEKCGFCDLEIEFLS